MAVALHVATDDGAFENVEGGEQGGGAVALVVMGHGAGAPLFHRQSLGAVERRDLALLVDRKDDGVRRRIDVKADDIAQLVDELRIVGELELLHPMRLQVVCPPDALDGADADPGRRRHHRPGPVGRLAGRVGERQPDHALGHIGAERRNARGPGIVERPSTATSPFPPSATTTMPRSIAGTASSAASTSPARRRMTGRSFTTCLPRTTPARRCGPTPPIARRRTRRGWTRTATAPTCTTSGRRVGQ